MTTLKAVRARFARSTGLPFANVLTEAKIFDVLNDHGIKYHGERTSIKENRTGGVRDNHHPSPRFCACI
jgi:hypothetical protein